LTFEFEAPGFLYNMIRVIVGTIVEVRMWEGREERGGEREGRWRERVEEGGGGEGGEGEERTVDAIVEVIKEVLGRRGRRGRRGRLGRLGR
jgi:hypothetical protein